MLTTGDFCKEHCGGHSVDPQWLEAAGANGRNATVHARCAWPALPRCGMPPEQRLIGRDGEEIN